MDNMFSQPLKPSIVAVNIMSVIPFIIKKISENCNLNTSNVQAGITEVVCFLDLISASDQPLTPSENIDLIWHELILFTRLYVRLCEQRYDRYIHHNPSEPNIEQRKRFRTTLELYKSKFGQPDPRFWGLHTNVCSIVATTVSNSNCGSCDTS